MRKRIYIAGPIKKGDLAKNIRQADDAMLALMRAGLAAFNPMLSCYAGGCDWRNAEDDDGEEYISPVAFADHRAHGGFRDLPYEDWYEQDLAWVAASDAVLRLPGESAGADGEVAFARANGIPVFTDINELIACLTAEDNTVAS